MTDADPGGELARLSTGVPGLDTVLNGGFLRGGVYIIQGRPGAGKTIFANQVCFHQALEGKRTLYVTLLAEEHARMIRHIENLSFFDRSAIPDRVAYLSGFRTLGEQGLKGLLELLRREIRTRTASLLVIDGLVAAEESTTASTLYKQFIHELQVQCGLLGCTVMLLTSGSRPEVHPEYTMVDGIFELDYQVFARRCFRTISAVKFRGSAIVEGQHTIDITSRGIVVYPRIESVFADPPDTESDGDTLISTGVDTLDVMLGGGLPPRTTTMVLGPTGVGKTCLGLHFLSRSNAEEPGLYFGFYETPGRTVAKADALGLGFRAAVERGDIAILWQAPTELHLDALAYRILENVQRRGVRRLFVDGFSSFRRVAVEPFRLSHFMTALANELRSRGVTTLYTNETPRIFTRTLAAPFTDDSSLVENLILLRYDERDARLRRLVSILKVRDSEFDPHVRNFEITSQGIRVARSSAGGVVAHPDASEPAPKKPRSERSARRTRRT